MKRYIKPNTEIHQIELTQMIAASGDTQDVQTKGNLGGGSGFTFGSKENNLTPTNLWEGDEEEE